MPTIDIVVKVPWNDQRGKQYCHKSVHVIVRITTNEGSESNDQDGAEYVCHFINLAPERSLLHHLFDASFSSIDLLFKNEELLTSCLANIK